MRTTPFLPNPRLYLYLGLGALFLGLACSNQASIRERRQRIRNVELLFDAYLEVNQPGLEPSIDDLFAQVAKKGQALNHVAAVNPQEPLYRLWPHGASTNSSPDAIVVEETTKVILHGYTVRAYLDGTVRVGRNPEGRKKARATPRQG